VSLFRDAARAQVAGLVLLAAGLSGCLGGGPGDQPRASGGAGIGAPIRTADCRDWRRASLRERYRTIDQIRRFSGGPSGSPGGHGPTLPDDTAYRIFENYCKKSFSDHLILYKLYTRAAAFDAR
jgi:hypothetical protein